ncbi:MAG: hypothetical protein H3C43_07350, partial [Leptonema sp. (in: Bacteria)]|nr:hypothetical protein [Leptonema sp. (in: bacteria)]
MNRVVVCILSAFWVFSSIWAHSPSDGKDYSTEIDDEILKYVQTIRTPGRVDIDE